MKDLKQLVMSLSDEKNIEVLTKVKALIEFQMNIGGSLILDRSKISAEQENNILNRREGVRDAVVVIDSLINGRFKKAFNKEEK